MDMEIEFFYKNFTEQNPELLMDHIRRMASGEASFISTTLSLIYDKLVERTFVHPTASGSGPVKSGETGDLSVTGTPTTQAQDLSTIVNSPSTPKTHLPSSQQEPEPEPAPLGAVWLRCFQCGESARMRDLVDGLRCPRCSSRGPVKGKQFMRCPSCNVPRKTRRETCIRYACQNPFM